MTNNIYVHIRNIAKASRSYISDFAEKNGFSMAEALVLLACGNADNPTQKDVVKYCAMDKSMITHSVRSLGERGYVRQEKDKSDKRCIRIILTDSGDEAFELLNRSLSIFNKGTISVLSEDESMQLEYLLGKLSNYIDKFDL